MSRNGKPHCTKVGPFWFCRNYAERVSHMNPVGFGVNAWEAYQDHVRRMT